MKKYVVAVVGATGAVGAEILSVLEERKLPIAKLVPLASANSAGKTIEFMGEEIKIKELTETVFKEEGVEIALFSAGGSISEKYAQFAVDAGAVVIDNTSFFRMQEDVPLVVPEVNAHEIKNWKNRGIIANPNCSTIQMVVALKPLNDAFGINRINVSTYQATSGAGASAMQELMDQMQGIFNFTFEDMKPKKFTHKIAVNVIPQIDKFEENGYTKEELKMVYETQKIFAKKMMISATCVRVPVLRGHSESISIAFDKEVDLAKAVELLKKGENIVVMDDDANANYPTPQFATGKDEVFVGRIRKDLYEPNKLHMWIVADNLRLGAATNAVKIAQKWIELEGGK